MRYYWPGNVRELSNAMEYAWIVSGGRPISQQHLPHDVRTGRPATPGLTVASATSYAPSTTLAFPSVSAPASQPVSTAPRGKTLEDVEMEYILQVYSKNNQNKQLTASELGISLKTLYNKLHKYEDERQRQAS
jgi:DNA-binding NtrC family response regulator